MKVFRYFLLTLFLSILPLASIFTTDLLFHTHDGLVHLPRIAAYFKALSDGQIPVRWAGDLNYGYGMPLFNFMYQIPYILSSGFIALGFGLVNSFKIVLSLSFILSGLFMFLFAREFFQDEKKALLVTIFYQFAPFRLVELLVRGSYGEIYTYTFFPLVLFFLVKLFEKRNVLFLLATGLATGFLILSHNALSLIFFGISVLFVLFFGKDRKNISAGLGGLFLGLMLTAFYFIPALLEHKYTHGDLYMRSLFREHFPPIQNFFIPNLTNAKELQTSGISVQFGLFHVVVILFALMAIFRKKLEGDNKKIVQFSLILIAGSLFMASPLSIPLWENISFLRQFQFPWRFLGVVVFATSLLSINFLSFGIFKKKWMFVLLLFLVMISTAFYWRPPLGYDKIDEDYYWNFSLNTTYYGETDVVWSAGPAKEYPKQRVELIGGEATVKDFKKKTTVHTFTVDALTSAQFVDHTQYYPGWMAYVDGQKTEIEYQDPNNRGEITFWVPSGKHKVEIRFQETKLRLAADLLSLFSIAVVFAGFIFFRNKRYA